MAVPPLRALVAAGHDVVLVVTRADRRRGRGERDVAEPGEGGGARARPAGHPRHRRPRSTIDAELGVVVAYGRIIKPHVLAALPMVNVHFSLLPRWRGAAPVERALLAGDDVTGVCIMGVEEGLDTGRASTPAGRCRSGPTTTAGELRAELVDVGTAAARRRAGRTAAGRPSRRPASRRTPTKIDARRAASSTGTARPSSSTGGCASAGRGRRSAAAGSRSTRPSVDGAAPATPGVLGRRRRRRSAPATGRCGCVTVQPEGKAADAWADFANGAHPRPGERLGDRSVGAMADDAVCWPRC